MGSKEKAPWIPLNAFMDAPTAGTLAWKRLGSVLIFLTGGPWPTGDSAPRAVSEEWYDTICPTKDRVTLDTETVAGHLKDSDAQTLIDFWSKKLRDMEDRCVEIDGREQVFHY